MSNEEKKAVSTAKITTHVVKSSQIFAIGHDAATNTLAIQFRTKADGPGSIYHYGNVDQRAFDDFRDAESIGSHFKKVIKANPTAFPYVKIPA